MVPQQQRSVLCTLTGAGCWRPQNLPQGPFPDYSLPTASGGHQYCRLALLQSGGDFPPPLWRG